MTDSKCHTTEPASLEGRVFAPADEAELREAVEQAFDFRGDVSIECKSGGRIEGYLFNREATVTNPYVQLFLKDRPGTIDVPYADIASIAFTGKDTASGKSWEAWLAKKESQRRAEAAQIEAEARSRGHL